MQNETLEQFARGLAYARRHTNTDITVLRLAILLCVAGNEGLSQRQLLNQLDEVSVTALSRNLADLSALNVRKEPGLGLIELRTDPMNLRVKQVHLTRKGRGFLKRLSAAMDGGAQRLA